MASRISELIVRILGDKSQFSGEMKKLNYELDAADKSISKTTSGFEKFGSRISSVGLGLTAAITAPLAGIAIGSVRAQQGFESSMNRVSALGSIYGADLKMLEAQATELGKATQFSGRQAADGMAEMASAGFDAEQIYAAMPGVLNLAAAGQLSVARAAEVAANTLQGFGLKTAQTGRVVDVLAKAAASGSLTTEDLAMSLKYVAPVATAAGLSFEETTAAITLMSNAGIKGEQAGTGFRGMIASLVAPSQDAQKTLDRLGISAVTSTGQLRPLAEIVGQLAERGATTKDIFEVFGRESASAVQALVAAGAPALRILNGELVNAEGAADKAAKVLNTGTTPALERMAGSITTAAESIGRSLAPAVQTVAGWVGDLANLAEYLATKFGELPGAIQAVAIGMAGLAAAAGPVLFILGELAGSASNLLILFRTLQGAAILPLLAKFGVLAAVVAGGAAAWHLIGTEIGRTEQMMKGADAGQRKLLEGTEQGKKAAESFADVTRDLNSTFGVTLAKTQALPAPLKRVAAAHEEAAVGARKMAVAHHEALGRMQAIADQDFQRTLREIEAAQYAIYKAGGLAAESIQAMDEAMGDVEGEVQRIVLPQKLPTAPGAQLPVEVVPGTVKIDNRQVVRLIELTAKMREGFEYAFQAAGRGMLDLIGRGGKLSTVLRQLGGDLVKALAQPLVDQAMKQLADLLWNIAKQVGGLLLKLPGLTGALGKLGGWLGVGGSAAGTAAKTAGTVAGTAGTVAGSAGSAAGGAVGAVGAAVSSVTGIVTAVGGLASAIFGNFQMKAMNKSLDLIEKEARYSQIHLLHLLEKANLFWPMMAASHERLKQMVDHGLGVVNAPGDGGLRLADGGGGNTIQITGNFLGFRDLDDLADQLVSRLKARGV